MIDNIWQIKDVRFFVPNYPLDGIQSTIVDSNNFFEHAILENLSEFINENSIICDIGTNIGNHTLYWLSQNNAKFVYCFEPRQETFEILEKNIKINKLTDRTQCFNLALSEKTETLSTSAFNLDNIGANSYIPSLKGNTIAQPLDGIQLEQRISFMKIDVEGMEQYVLNGARETIKNHKPIIFIEIFGENYNVVNNILKELGYSIFRQYPDSNYLYTPDVTLF